MWHVLVMAHTRRLASYAREARVIFTTYLTVCLSFHYTLLTISRAKNSYTSAETLNSRTICGSGK